MITRRIIPCLDVRDGKVVKGVQFKNHKIVGSIVDLAKKYSDRVIGLIDGKITFDEKSININEAYLKKIYS